MILTDPDRYPMLLQAVILGMGATLFMDLVASARRRFFNTPSLDYALVGRWIGYLPRGVFIHRPIVKTAPVTGEKDLGWDTHYLIGIVFAALFLMIETPDWPGRPELLPSLGFGLLTVAAPFFLLQPCLGAGIAARNTPHPWLARLNSATAHLSFGLGLWVTGWVMALAVWG